MAGQVYIVTRRMVVEDAADREEALQLTRPASLVPYTTDVHVRVMADRDAALREINSTNMEGGSSA